MSENPTAIEVGETRPREELIESILEKQRTRLPEYRRTQSSPHSTELGTVDTRTVWNASPPGVEITSSEFGGPEFDLLRPVNGNVTTYNEGSATRFDGNKVLNFAAENGYKAGSYLTAKPVTESMADIESDGSIPAFFKGRGWHRQNMGSREPAKHYVIDAQGKTVIIEELSIDPARKPSSYGSKWKQRQVADALVDAMPQIKSYANYEGSYFKILGSMTEKDLVFYEKALDAYRDVTKAETKLGKWTEKVLAHARQHLRPPSRHKK